ncbi:MAG: isocitrate/isopropylmalate dehydrogenase family protein [Acidobacteriota bacterium]
MYKITLIPGDGIGPEVTEATRRVIDASGVEVSWEIAEAGEHQIAQHGTPLPDSVLDSIKKNGIALKGPITTPVGKGFRSVNVTLRKELDLWANVRPSHNYPGIASRYENVNLTIVRENTEDLYAGIEYWASTHAGVSVKVITREASMRISRFAFELARKTGRRKVTCAHKANIMKISDGLFLDCFREAAVDYPEIEAEDRIIDALCMQLVQKPDTFEILVMANLYGDITSDLCAGLVGGLGVAPGANIGDKIAVFEPVHGSAPDIAGQGLANPLATLLSGVLMLEHLGEQAAAGRIRNAVWKALEDDCKTADLGGRLKTNEMADAIIARINA